jgi:hypothetical protein
MNGSPNLLGFTLARQTVGLEPSPECVRADPKCLGRCLAVAPETLERFEDVASLDF